MNKKEAEDIAWELCRVIECADNIMGVDAASEVANSAIDAVFNIIKKHPKIKRETEVWKNLKKKGTVTGKGENIHERKTHFLHG